MRCRHTISAEPARDLSEARAGLAFGSNSLDDVSCDTLRTTARTPSHCFQAWSSAALGE
jgi:hypothetical protein